MQETLDINDIEGLFMFSFVVFGIISKSKSNKREYYVT
jgi:hypothetical protein